MLICNEKPDILPPLDIIRLEPSDVPHYSMSHDSSSRGGCAASTGLGIRNFKPGTPNPFSMDNSATPGSGGASNKTSEEHFAVANWAVSIGGAKLVYRLVVWLP